MISKENNESAALVAQDASRVFPTELFLHIMEILRDYCDDETLETLASTCTEFEELALKFQHHGLDTRHFGAAFQPVRSNLGRRFQDWTEHLREIIVQPCRNVLFLWFLDKEDSKELVDFIRKCTFLTKVTVFVEGGAIPEFWDWVASCQTLRALELVPGGGDGMTLPMTGIKFPPGLRRLHIDFRDEHEKERDCLFTEAANDAFLNKIAKAPLIESFSIEGGRAVGFKPERNKAALAKLMHLETYYLGAIEPLLQVPEFRPKSLTLTNDSFKEPLTVDQLRQIWPKIAALDSLEKLEVSAGLADPVLEKLPTNVRRLLLQGLLTNFSNYDQEKVKKVLKVGTKEFVKVSVRVRGPWVGGNEGAKSDDAPQIEFWRSIPGITLRCLTKA